MIAFFIVLASLAIVVSILAGIKVALDKRAITPVLAETAKQDEESQDLNQ